LLLLSPNPRPILTGVVKVVGVVAMEVTEEDMEATVAMEVTEGTADMEAMAVKVVAGDGAVKSINWKTNKPITLNALYTVNYYNMIKKK
jgi:hypothetical protein